MRARTVVVAAGVLVAVALYLRRPPPAARRRRGEVAGKAEHQRRPSALARASQPAPRLASGALTPATELPPSARFLLPWNGTELLEVVGTLPAGEARSAFLRKLAALEDRAARATCQELELAEATCREVGEHLAAAQAARTRVVDDLGAAPDGRASARVSLQTAQRRFGSELSSVLGAQDVAFRSVFRSRLLALTVAASTG